MDKPIEILGVEGYEETREQGQHAISDAVILIQGNKGNIDCDFRLNIRRIETHIEYEYNGVPFKAFFVSRSPEEPAGAGPVRR